MTMFCILPIASSQKEGRKKKKSYLAFLVLVTEAHLLGFHWGYLGRAVVFAVHK